VEPIAQNVKLLSQVTFIPVEGSDVASLGDDAYVYVPSNCSKINSGCRVHVSFHGCRQTIANIKSDYYLKTGYNGWAEANNIIVLYPQAKNTTFNPNGCWDWWGFTGSNYATKKGVQVAAVKNMVDHLMKIY